MFSSIRDFLLLLFSFFVFKENKIDVEEYISEKISFNSLLFN